MTLKSFPRGGKKLPEKKSHSQLKKNEKPSKRDREKEKTKTNKDVNLVAYTAERLQYSTICEGLIVLGCVFEVTEYDLIISLPGGVLGHAQITDISESYTNMLQGLIKSEENQPSDFKPLPVIYSPGDYVVCCVKSIQLQGNWQVLLSLEPQLINQNLNISHLDNGSKIVCTVSSIEDHGYVVDIGLTNVRAFIPAKKDNNEAPLFPGKQLLCHVKEMKTSENTSIITLSVKQKYLKAKYNADMKSLDSFTPGTKFELTIKRILSNGLYVSFGENYIGYINQLYLDEPLSTYSKGMEIIGTLLYIMPTVKFGYFSLLIGKPKDNTIKLGEIVEDATVLCRESGGIVLQLTNKVRGFLPLKRTNVDFDKIIEKFVPGTKHKCRVLSYNWMDCTYVCTMQQSLLEQQYFRISDFKPGDLVNVTITSINTERSFVYVQAGKIKGHVTSEHVSDAGLSALKKLKVNSQVEARVLHTDSTLNKVYFTLKKSLLASDLPILSDIKQAKCGSKYYGTIVQINRHGLLVKFFGDIKGWVPRTALDKEASAVKWNYSAGQTILVKIESIDENSRKIMLRTVTKTRKTEENTFIIGELVKGTVTESSAQGVYLRISKNDGQNVSTGYLPAGHMSVCVEIGTLLSSKYIPGDTLSALVFATAPSLILTRTFSPSEKYKNFDELKIGDTIPCSIRDIEPDGLRVILPVTGCSSFGYVSYSNVTNFSLLHRHQILFSQIISINKKDKQLGLTLSLKKIYDGLPDDNSRITSAVDTLNLYLTKIDELANNSFYKNKLISSATLGQRVTGKIEKITNAGLVVRLENDLIGIVNKSHYSGSLKVGDTISGTIMWKNYLHQVVELTMLPLEMKSINAKQNQQLNLPAGKVMRGTILMVTNWFVLIVLKGQGKGSLVAMPVRRHMNDVQPDLSPYVVHSKIRCYIILDANESNIVPICMVKSAFEAKCNEEAKPNKTAEKRKKKDSQNEVPTKKIKAEVTELKVKNSKQKSNKADTKQKKEKKSKKIKEEDDVKPFINNLNDDTSDSSEDEEKPRMSECGFFWDDKPDLDLLEKKESSSDSEDEAEQKPKQKKKKLSAAERREQERQKEREIRQREEALASNQLPNSVDQFDRLVLASPDSSIIWLQYMAYHLQTTEIEKARAVARRAIKTINFREENERLNVWNAWLNLESKFGTSESLNDVFKEAVRTNDSLKVYTHMLTMHAEAGRQIELERTINTMLGKFKQNPQVWIECGTALLNMGLKDKSRHIMQRALQSLPASEHVNLMTRFALLENKCGDKERAQTLFEQILTSYPKRVDIWSCYIDSLIKSNDIDIARKILERAVVQTLPPRKMKTLFKKFISFEERHGNQEGVARIQQMAAEYVEKQCNKEY